MRCLHLCLRRDAVGIRISGTNSPLNTKHQMTRAFTINWTPDGWAGLPEGQPIRAAAGSKFVGKVSPGDRVFVTNVLKGKLRLLGGFTVGRVFAHSDGGKPPEAIRTDEQYLVAIEGTSAPAPGSSSP